MESSARDTHCHDHRHERRHRRRFDAGASSERADLASAEDADGSRAKQSRGGNAILPFSSKKKIRKERENSIFLKSTPEVTLEVEAGFLKRARNFSISIFNPTSPLIL